MFFDRAILAISLVLSSGEIASATDSVRTTINDHAAIVADTELWIDAEPKAVWAILTDVPKWTEWLPEFVSARLDGPLAPGTTLYWEPQGQKIVSRLVVVEPPHRLIWNGSGGAVHVWELASVRNGTMLRNAESIEQWTFPEASGEQRMFLRETLGVWNARLAARVKERRKTE